MRRRKLGGAQGKSGSSQDRSTGAKGGCSPGLKPASDRFPRDYCSQYASRDAISASASKGTPALISSTAADSRGSADEARRYSVAFLPPHNTSSPYRLGIEVNTGNHILNRSRQTRISGRGLTIIRRFPAAGQYLFQPPSAILLTGNP